MKIFSHRISIQTLFFPACLPTRQNGVENRDKAYSHEALSILSRDILLNFVLTTPSSKIKHDCWMDTIFDLILAKSETKAKN